MCKRTCPNCGSKEHAEQYGIIGTSIICTNCLTILANKRDEQAALTGLSNDEIDQWVAEGTFVLEGAEAEDPKDDEFFTIPLVQGGE